jgi:GxxExxY protein
MNHEEHEGRGRFTKEAEDVARAVVDSGLAVHRALGAGLLESAYEQCLSFELESCGLSAAAQVVLPLTYAGRQVSAGFRVDLLVEDLVIVEVKSVDALSRAHEAQLLTYLKLSGCRIGLLMNFNVALFRDGLRRLVR